MSSTLNNPIYQHSSETEKISPVAQQAAVNEDLEQRRRQIDSQGETRKIILAKEVSHIIDASGTIHLKPTSYEVPAEPIVQQAQASAANILYSALEAGKSILHSASVATEVAVGKASAAAGAVTQAAIGAADTAAHVGIDAATALTTATKDAAGYVTNATLDAAGYVSQAAQEAAHKSASIAKKVVDTTATAAGVVGHKTLELAEGATNKAYEVADNITHFTTLVSVLAAEEGERARRLVAGDEALRASNAFRVSELIRDLGIAFYRQETPNLNYSTLLLEEMERRWRLNSHSSALAESNAHTLGKIVSSNLQSFMPRHEWVRAHINTIEEKERTRRLNDENEAYAILNSVNTAALIHGLGYEFYRQEGSFGLAHRSYATTLLEENERRFRIRANKLIHAEDSAHLLMDVVANNIEKFNYSTRHAARFANEFANKLGSATLQVASVFSNLTKDLAQNAAQRARAVAGDLTNFTTLMYLLALEEKERARRLTDSAEIRAIDNAWKQSALIRELEGFYKSTSPARYPSRIFEELERSWRVAEVVAPTRARAVAALVSANLSKFELAQQRAAAREVALHSRLNPLAPAFVPVQHSALPAKAEFVPVRSNVASGAQL